MYTYIHALATTFIFLSLTFVSPSSARSSHVSNGLCKPSPKSAELSSILLLWATLHDRVGGITITWKDDVCCVEMKIWYMRAAMVCRYVLIQTNDGSKCCLRVDIKELFSALMIIFKPKQNTQNKRKTKTKTKTKKGKGKEKTSSSTKGLQTQQLCLFWERKQIQQWSMCRPSHANKLAIPLSPAPPQKKTPITSFAVKVNASSKMLSVANFSSSHGISFPPLNIQSHLSFQLVA